MVEITKLSIIPCSGIIQLECHIPYKPYFENVYIDQVIIDTQDTYTDSGPSKTPIYKYKPIPTTRKFKELSLTIHPEDLLVQDINNTLFFVYVTTKIDGAPSPDIPCGLDNPTTLKVVFNEDSIYRGSLNYIKEAYQECSIPKKLIDYILRLRAFQLCLKAKNYKLAISYWNKFLNKSIQIFNKCSCNG